MGARTKTLSYDSNIESYDLSIYKQKHINTYKHQQWRFGFLFWCMEQIYEPLTKQTDYIGCSLSKKHFEWTGDIQ